MVIIGKPVGNGGTPLRLAPGSSPQRRALSSDPAASDAATNPFFRGLGKYLSGALALIVALMGVLAQVESADVRRFVKHHPAGIYFVLIISIAVIILMCYVIYYLVRELRSARQAEQIMRASLPTNGDRATSKRILSAIPPSSDVIRWLKLEFNPASLPASSFRSLTKINETLVLGPADFSEEATRAKYEAFLRALSEFLTAIKQETRVDPTGTHHNVVPREWDDKARYEAAKRMIEKTGQHLVESYYALIGACQKLQEDA